MHKVRASLLQFLVFSQLVSASLACPFCSAVSQSFSEEMATMDVVAIARFARQRRSDLSSSDPQEEVPLTIFEFSSILKGQGRIKVGDAFETIYLGTPGNGDKFLVMAVGNPKAAWSTPLAISERAAKYLQELPGLPAGPARLEFFQNHLEDQDEMLARDAYNEFARAPYAELVALKEKMNRLQLVEFIQNPEVPSLRRKLYFTMLGICGVKEDARLLEEFMTSEDGKSGLDAMLACYLNLTGEHGLDKIDELFLANHDADFVDINAAVVALRFHGEALSVISRKRLLKSLRNVLEIPPLADLVIADLARWEDWSAIPQLCELFEKADADSSFVRVPVINFLQACPLPIAQAKIEELKLIDAEAVNYATARPDSGVTTLEPSQPTLGDGTTLQPQSSEVGEVGLPAAIADPVGRKSTTEKPQFYSLLLIGGLIFLAAVVLASIFGALRRVQSRIG